MSVVESCVGAPYAEAPYGATIDLTPLVGLSMPQALFGEDHGRAILSTSADLVEALVTLAATCEVPLKRIGTVTDPRDPIEFGMQSGQIALDSVMARDTFMNAIPRRMQAPFDVKAAD